MFDKIKRLYVSRKNAWLYGLTALILILGLAVLLYLERRVVSDRRAAFENARDLLGRERILKTNDDIHISFSEIESLVSSILKNPFIKDIYITKVIAGRGEHVIIPFYYYLLPDNRRPNLSRLIREPLSEGGEILGYLYIVPNNNIILSVRAVAVTFALFLLLTLVSLFSRVHAQEQVITATTIELEEKRREMIRLERLALAGQVSANILHDIKKPVLNIKQESQELEKLTSPEEVRGIALGIREQVDLFFGILHDLGLERFVKASEGGEEFLSVNDILERSCRLVRYERGSVEVKFDLAKNLPLLFAHPSKMIQLFSNIILNAYQAMGGKGELLLRTGQEAGSIQIEIKDTGPGIPHDVIPRLFTPFFTMRSASSLGDEGTGLGLYISKNIVDDMKGEIHVESTVGKGTKFIITLPVPEKMEVILGKS